MTKKGDTAHNTFYYIQALGADGDWEGITAQPTLKEARKTFKEICESKRYKSVRVLRFYTEQEVMHVWE